ncbi:MAG: sodium:calcium antiporter [Bacteroidia bacterium]|nr:MAG: sodium:calcium antiporter [Bacteroidia bacterium]
MEVLTYILFVAGFILLVYGANWLVDGAASIARRYHISNVVIGMTIVALGTSAPELVVNLVASFKGTADVALGNVLGSNVSNILLILGVSALLFPLAVNHNTLWKEVPFAILGAALVGILANDALLDGIGQSKIYRSDGIVLILFFVLFSVYAFGISRQKGIAPVEKNIREFSMGRSLLLVIAGIVALVAGGRWIVQGAVEIASTLGMSEAVISLTIVALGTSLPELATCVAAALKKNVDIVIGNVLGSNIFNVFFVLGTSAVIKPLPFNEVLNFDIFVGLGAVMLLWAFLAISGKNTLQRWQGVLFILLYIAYIAFLLIRG